MALCLVMLEVGCSIIRFSGVDSINVKSFFSMLSSMCYNRASL